MKGFCTCILSTFVVILFSGCGVAFEGHTPQLTQFDNQYNSKICDYQIVQQKIAKKDDLILWGILGGSLAFNCADYQKSIEFFDIAEEVYKADVDMQSVGSSVMDSAKSILVNKIGRASCRERVCQ